MPPADEPETRSTTKRVVIAPSGATPSGFRRRATSRYDGVGRMQLVVRVPDPAVGPGAVARTRLSSSWVTPPM